MIDAAQERAKLIREGWQRVRISAIDDFLAGRGNQVRIVLPEKIEVRPYVAGPVEWPTLNAFDVVIYRFEARPEAPPNIWAWRVVCEDVALEYGSVRLSKKAS